jgi:hypothetical protein
MSLDKPVSFSGKEPPWKGVTNVPSYKIDFDTGASQRYAFNKTNLFFRDHDQVFKVNWRAPSLAVEAYNVLNKYMPEVAETSARSKKVSAARD